MPQFPAAEEGDADDSAVLIAGRHRMEACKRLEMGVLPVLVHDGTDDQARMWEISENLHRANLTALERSKRVAEWHRLSGDRQVRQVDAPGGRQPKEQGIRAASRVLGVAEPEARRSVKVDALSSDAKRVAREVGRDSTQSALLDAAKQPTSEAQVRSLTDRVS